MKPPAYNPVLRTKLLTRVSLVSEQTGKLASIFGRVGQRVQISRATQFPGFSFLVSLGLFLLVTSALNADDYLWTGLGGDSVWNNQQNWVNQSTGSTVNGFPTLSHNASFNSSATTSAGGVNNLAVGLGGNLTVATGQISLNYLNNNGTIQFSGNNNESLVFQGSNPSLSGSGSIVLNSDYSPNIYQGNIRIQSSNSTLINGVSHSIRGDGHIQIGNNTLSLTGQSFVNYGLVELDTQSTGSQLNFRIGRMRGNSTQSTFINHGTLSVTDGSYRLMNICSDTFRNYGEIQIGSDAQLLFESTTLRGSDIGNVSLGNNALFRVFDKATLAFNLDGKGEPVDRLHVPGNFFLENYQFPGSLGRSFNYLSISHTNGFQSQAGQYIELVTIDGINFNTYTDSVGNIRTGGTFDGLAEGAVVGNFGAPLRITYKGGDGNDIALVTTQVAGSQNFNLGTSGGDVYFVGNYSAPGGSSTVFNYNSFELLSGQSFDLGPGQTMNLNNGNGTFWVNQGSVLTGNGVINGNIVNSGLVIIPIVQLGNLGQVSGGYVQVTGSSIGQSATVNHGTYVSFQPGGSSPSNPTAVVQNNGMIGWDASLEITGSYLQTSTGGLRLFVAGEVPGINYSQLQVGQEVTLNGELQLVFDLPKFKIFDFEPTVGQTFDFIVADGGITTDLSTLNFSVFVTEEMSSLVSGITLSSYTSSYSGDPNQLLRINEHMFDLELVENGTVLRGTLNRSFSLSSVPEPSAGLLCTGSLIMLMVRRRKSQSGASV